MEIRPFLLRDMALELGTLSGPDCQEGDVAVLSTLTCAVSWSFTLMPSSCLNILLPS